MSDQPVFALSLEVKLRDHRNFGKDNYVCLLGDLHIEHSLLAVRGNLIKGRSGLDTIMQHADLSTTGTSTIIDVNDIK